jgi:hypothetical protein
MKPEKKYKGSIKLSVIGDVLGWMAQTLTHQKNTSHN